MRQVGADSNLKTRHVRAEYCTYTYYLDYQEEDYW